MAHPVVDNAVAAILAFQRVFLFQNYQYYENTLAVLLSKKSSRWVELDSII
jgi:hypothetical protein